ncbi:sugar phosphate isomerase/epimerase [Coraliomargarita sinensis]|uniref:Sugar phosphate isomerase/epimerase n=1 Tax=Coraliomargarita sinensis TaxID=2174842 RepID=A0A317ZND6_9BACT|nr:sugar phosphate isomerase/epimerase [Coraliomargarita sinensis]PXA05388.1 sugar phosphate isomerase/epimerase [Coraliomargarita sinensis]
MQLSGFTDEAGKDLATQIKACKELGWTHLSARSIGGTNIHELSEDDFRQAADQLDEAGIQVVEFGSLIGNWAKPISSDFDITLAEIDRAIPRMKRLNTNCVRIMSYAMEPWGENQQDTERFRRLREIVKRFEGAGLQAVHENCQNYGGFSAEHTLRLVEEVPGLKLVFDTGNPVFTRDRSKPEPHPWQDALEFYRAVKAHVAHVHVKDCLNPPEGSTEPEKYTMPGEGQARLLETLKEMKADGYNGGFAIEPHVATVFHVQDGQEPDWQQCYDSFIAYGKAFEAMVRSLD